MSEHDFDQYRTFIRGIIHSDEDFRQLLMNRFVNVSYILKNVRRKIISASTAVESYSAAGSATQLGLQEIEKLLNNACSELTALIDIEDMDVGTVTMELESGLDGEGEGLH